MRHLIKKGTIPLCFSALLVFIALVPSAHAYGTSFGTAETITNGNVNQVLVSTNSDAYYKISCSRGDNLQITLTYSGVLNLYLYNPSQTLVDYSESTGSPEYFTYSVLFSGDYYIKLTRCCGGLGDLAIIMDVSGATPSPAVPGFDLLVL